MNDQNIKNLVAYITKNPNLSPSQLEETVLKAGYSSEELSQALEIIGKSQVRSSLFNEQNMASVEPEVLKSEENKLKKKKWLFVLLGILIILAIWDVTALYLINQDKINKKVTSPTPTSLFPPPSKDFVKPTEEPLATQPPPTIAQTNPMDAFFTALSSTDYKVTTSGKIENKKEEEGHSQTLSLDLNNGIVYTQKGIIVRVDKIDPQRPEIAILKDDKIYNLDPEKKTYIALNTADDMGKFYLTAIKASFPLIPLSEDSQKGIVSWQKSGSNEWQADWKWKTPLDPKETPVKVKIILNPATNLITTFSMRFEESQLWQDVTFKYEKIESIDGLLTIPSDYKEEKLGY